ncbi:bifunctional metallophosphatase/5'-nucleotidase [Pseudoclavibacter helvolus]|uniref:5'-nucleotidase n=1 Tax=Pseudoclavibacter helvolus TaxID=255205 RepID=A0A7W4UR92_9MICO|nr:bifunctional UDP-sugar hydrolase/5'-nucleotidase [Pseudoclavibacter helvolus]MBB2958557.1 5'-nucleotidase [Pseudoclavibacter helvolus]
MTTPTRKRATAAAAVLGTAALVSAFAAPAQAAVLSPSFIEPTAGAKQINIVGFNDFHGRFLEADLFAATVLQAQQGFGEENSLVISNGDAVGASLFESSIQQDQPTIDVLNTIGVDSWTQGNHEFDQGIDDATGRISPATNGPDLAANVTLADGSHPFDTHAIFEVNGLKVAVIGAVTEETSALVSPDGIKGVTFGDPVEAVNKVAAELTASKAADVIIASYHEGAPNSDVPLATNEETEAFRHIVQDTAPEVDAIFNAHSHREYAYDAPNGASTRPVIQAGQYAENIAQVALTVDASGNVTKSDSSVVPTLEAVPAALESDPRIAEVRKIRDAAVAEADVLGAEVVGTQTGDLSRGKEYEPGTLVVAEDGTTSGGVVKTADNRADESSLGGIVSQSMLESVASTGRDVDAAIMNPGGLRADLLDNDGQITYKEAATVLPFANNLSVVSLKGVDLKNVLEEQWQLTASGAVPSRPYLQLGLSDNFSYIFDSSRPRMERIVGLSINDEPVKPDETYNIVMPTFLAAGGDNFHSLNNNVGVQDTGLIDLDAFVSWIRSETAASPEGVTPDVKRNGIEIIGLPENNTFVAGETYTLTVSKFNLTSLGFKQNLFVVGWIGQMELGAEQVDLATPNEVQFTFTLSENGIAETSESRLAFMASQSGAIASLPVIVPPMVDPTATPEPTASATPTATATTAPVPTATTPAADGGSLATTGADENAIFAAIAGALALLVAGGAAILLRRRAGSDA